MVISREKVWREDKRLRHWLIGRSESTQETYLNAMGKYLEFTKMTPEQLVQEKWKDIQKPPMGTTPSDVVLSMDVLHPQDEPIEKVYLVLRDINMNKIQTITSFTMHRSNLFQRIIYLDFEWPCASPDERSAMMNEISTIDIQWVYAPS